MKLRRGFVSNSSSSSFVIQLKKDLDKYTLDEFYKALAIPEDLKVEDYQCQPLTIKECVESLFGALINQNKLTESKYKAPCAYEVEIGDLAGMEETEKAYDLLQEIYHKSGLKDILIANNDIAVIHLY